MIRRLDVGSQWTDTPHISMFRNWTRCQEDLFDPWLKERLPAHGVSPVLRFESISFNPGDARRILLADAGKGSLLLNRAWLRRGRFPHEAVWFARVLLLVQSLRMGRELVIPVGNLFVLRLVFARASG